MTDDEKTAARNEIAELMQRYAIASDFNDRAAYALLYTEDGVLDLPGARHQGRDALRAMPKPEGLKRRHFFMPPVLEFADGKAEGRGYCIVFSFDTEANKAAAPRTVDYNTTYAWTTEGWRISNHVVRPSFGG